TRQRSQVRVLSCPPKSPGQRLRGSGRSGASSNFPAISPQREYASPRMAFIEKRVGKRGSTYAVRYRDPNAREREKSFKRKADAQNFVTEVEGGKLRGTFVDLAGAKTRFADWAA